MAETGDYVTPMIIVDGDWVPYLGKPPFFFWMNAVSIEFFGANVFAVRFPNVVLSVLFVFGVFGVFRRYRGSETAWLAAVATATTGLFFIVANTVLADVALTAFSMGALFAYHAFLEEESPRGVKVASFLVFVLLGLGFLVKGPVVLVLFGLPVFLWTLLNDKWATLKRHAWFSGCAVFLAITVPWFYFAAKVHPDFLRYFFVNENFLRFVSSGYGDRYGTGHEYPHGMSLVFFLAGAQPWLIILLISAVYAAFKSGAGKRWRRFRELLGASAKDDRGRVDLFFLGFISIALFWCLAKQLHFYYLLPAMPPFAAWCAGVFKRHSIGLKSLAPWAWTALAVYAVAAVSVPLVSRSKGRTTDDVSRVIASSNDGIIPDGTVVFLGKTPYSAYFYLGDAVELHTKETFASSLSRGARVYVLKAKDIDKLPAGWRSGYKVVSRIGAWIVLKRGGGHGGAGF
jgi:4-amino-4-deoxy-L-arabinose transferase-like glycosyltransferase